MTTGGGKPGTYTIQESFTDVELVEKRYAIIENVLRSSKLIDELSDTMEDLLSLWGSLSIVPYAEIQLDPVCGRTCLKVLLTIDEKIYTDKSFRTQKAAAEAFGRGMMIPNTLDFNHMDVSIK